MRLDKSDTMLAVLTIDYEGFCRVELKNLAWLSTNCSPYKVPTYSHSTYRLLCSAFPSDLHTDLCSATIVNRFPKIPQLKMVYMPLDQLWLEHPRCSAKERITYNPCPSYMDKAAMEHELNIFPGFRYSRDKVLEFRDFRLIVPLLMHIRFTWCDSDNEFNQVIGQFALLFQEPWLKQGVAICLNGPEESGKSFVFVNVIGFLLGPNFMHIQNMEEIAGNFNSVMRNKLLVFVDESLFAGNEGQNNIVKNLITGDTQRVREMYKDTVYKESFLNLGFASNNDWFISAGTGARRYFILRSDCAELINYYKASHAEITDKLKYFSWLRKLLTDNDNAALKTFQNFLQNLPMDNFDPCNFPVFKALIDQKIQSFKPLERFWFDCLYNATQYSRKVLTPDGKGKQTEVFKKQPWAESVDLEVFYGEFARVYSTKFTVRNQRQWLMGIKDFCPGIGIINQPRIAYHGFYEVATEPRPVVIFPNLEVACQQFNIHAPGIEMAFKPSLKTANLGYPPFMMRMTIPGTGMMP